MSSILRMIVSSEIQAQNKDFLAEFFSNTWNCQILFLHNLRDLVKWQAWVENQINLQKSDSEGFSDIFRPY